MRLHAPARAHAASASRQKMSLHARRQRLRALMALVFVVAIGAIVLGVSKFSYSPRFMINNVAVVGTKEVPAKLVRAYVETKLYDGTHPILSRDNIFLYPSASIEKSISEYFPRIRAADISRAGLLAQAITVTVTERQPIALWCSGTVLPSSDMNDCYFMDDSGFVFAPLEARSSRAAAATLGMPLTGFASATSSPVNSYLIFGGGLSASSSPIGQTFLPAHFSGVLELDKLLQKEGFAPVGTYAENDQDFSVKFKDGFTLRALFVGEDANTLVRNLQLALASDSLRGKEKRLEYIDLRFGNRLYFKFKGEAEKQGTE